MMPPTARTARLAAACSIAAVTLLSAVGCGGGNGRSAQPLTADDFARRNGVSTGDNRGNGQTGETLVGPGDAPASGDPVRPQAPTPPPASSDNPGGISPAVAQAVPGPADLDPTSRPTSRPAGGGGAAEVPKAGEGVWVPIGSVVMEVNSQPIYSDRVLKMLEKPLSAEAKRNNPAQFKQVAAQLIGQQVQALKQEELEVAAAEKNLGTQDKAIADSLTMQWRAKQITAAGGSLELARKRYRDEGQDFEDEVARARRRYLVQLFYSKKVFNLVAAPAYAIREYYQQNLDKEFTTHAKLRFRVIRIDPSGSKPVFVNKDEAVAFAEKLKKRAATEDFGKLADEVMADGSGGRAGTPKNDYWIQPGSYRYEAVEKAVAALRPGQVTDVVPEGGLLFVAKLENVQEAKVKPFDDPEVQETIAQKLKGQQVQAMRERHIRDLERSAVTQYKQGKMEEMLEVAMRRYPEWAGPKAAIGP